MEARGRICWLGANSLVHQALFENGEENDRGCPLGCLQHMDVWVSTAESPWEPVPGRPGLDSELARVLQVPGASFVVTARPSELDQLAADRDD
jgi:hypothetical protein